MYSFSYSALKVPVYSIKNPPPVQKRPKTTNNHNRPRIEFNPQAKELIFRVETFECKIIEFILFYDEESEKFGIKNPSKVFESFDMDVVRTFNYHKDVNKLYSEFCLLVVYFIDDVDDLPKYEGLWLDLKFFSPDSSFNLNFIFLQIKALIIDSKRL